MARCSAAFLERDRHWGSAREVVLDEAGHDHGGAVGLTADFYNRVCMPLFAAMVVALFLVTFIPAISLCIPYLCGLVPGLGWLS